MKTTGQMWHVFLSSAFPIMLLRQSVHSARLPTATLRGISYLPGTVLGTGNPVMETDKTPLS